ncbi:MAG TPA: GNAT family N-acetyltransferase [Gaiellaceae bacterium]|nr:GNAT family N-acetyltransferase [Gaiellaceae bacterium]
MSSWEKTVIHRRFRREDKAAVISLLRGTFDDWNGDWAERYWEWKFEQNPHGAARIWVGDDDGRIAGCYIWTPVQLRFDGATLLGAESVDAAVHRDYRGQGVFTKLARAAVEDESTAELALVYAFPVEGAYGGQVRVGFAPWTPVAGIARPLLSAPIRRRRFPDLALAETAQFDSRFEAFSNGRSDWELTVQHDADYLQWRYRKHPSRTYGTIACERDGEITGYCVLTLDPTPRRLTRGYIVDLQVLPKSGETAAFLVDHALRRLRAGGARVAISWLRPSGLEREALESFGFSSRYQTVRRLLKRDPYVPQFLVFESHAGELDDLLARRGARGQPRWSLVPGDSDSI